jgi:hypothetical protein
MVNRWVLYALISVIMFCEKVDGHGWGEREGGNGYGAGALLFEIIIIVAIVAFWVWLFQMMDGASYIAAWQAPPPIPVIPPQQTCASVRISLSELKGVIKKVVHNSIHSEMKHYHCVGAPESA